MFKPLIDLLPWQGLLFPLAVLFLVWLGFKFFDSLVCVIRAIFKRGRGRLRLAFLVLGLSAGVSFGQVESCTLYGTINQSAFETDGVRVCFSGHYFCNLCGYLDNYIAKDHKAHLVTYCFGCSCSHGSWEGTNWLDCASCSGLWSPDEGGQVSDENLVLWGFGSAVAVFGALFTFRIVYKSIFRGLDLIERD